MMPRSWPTLPDGSRSGDWLARAAVWASPSKGPAGKASSCLLPAPNHKLNPWHLTLKLHDQEPTYPMESRSLHISIQKLHSSQQVLMSVSHLSKAHSAMIKMFGGFPTCLEQLPRRGQKGFCTVGFPVSLFQRAFPETF